MLAEPHAPPGIATRRSQVRECISELLPPALSTLDNARGEREWLCEHFND